MDLHVKVLAAFYLIFGVLGILGSLMVLLIFGGAAGIISMAAPNDPDALLAVPIVGLIGGILVMLIFTLSVPGIIAGIGLLKRRPWARIPDDRSLGAEPDQHLLRHPPRHLRPVGPSLAEHRPALRRDTRRRAARSTHCADRVAPHDGSKALSEPRRPVPTGDEAATHPCARIGRLGSRRRSNHGGRRSGTPPQGRRSSVGRAADS